MALHSHLTELEKKHRAIERQIADALMHPSSDALKIAELKRRKLQLKDEISRLKQNIHLLQHGHRDIQIAAQMVH